MTNKSTKERFEEILNDQLDRPMEKKDQERLYTRLRQFFDSLQISVGFNLQYNPLTQQIFLVPWTPNDALIINGLVNGPDVFNSPISFSYPEKIEESKGGKIHGPIPPEIMRKYGNMLKPLMPTNVGFVILTFEFRESKGPNYNGYISTGQRVDCIKALRECADSLESQLN